MKLSGFLNVGFPFLNSRKKRLLYLIVTLVLCAFFLFGLEVFNLGRWMHFPQWISFLGVLGFLLAGFIVMVLSQFVMAWVVKKGEFKRWHWMAWLIFELVLITFLITFVYGDENYSYAAEWFSTFKYTFLILVLPYSFSLLLMVVLYPQDKPVNTDLSKTHVDLFHFVDEREQIKLSVKPGHVLYLESADNYITIYYREGDSVKHELIRSSLKRIETEFIGKGLVRCHRSFAVNIENVESIKKEGRGYKIKVKYVDRFIPVSKGFTPTFTALISN